MATKTITIDGQTIVLEKTKTILEVAREQGIYIPVLCYLKEVTPTGSCRMCVVEVEGIPRPVPACSTAVSDGMIIKTNTPRIQLIRKTIVELLIANHPMDCLYCVRNGDCELQELAEIYEIRDHQFQGSKRINPLDQTSMALVRDPNKCILCQRCVKVCDEIQSVHAIDLTKRGFESIVTSAFDRTIHESSCVLCGQCVRVCPTGALIERSIQSEVRDNLLNPDVITTVQVAPSISATIGEEFGFAPGTDVSGKLVTALKRMGFDAVFDTVFGADLTIMEEGNELVKRITSNKTLPMISTCCPAWIKFMEQEFPDLIPHMSTCKSPMSMQGAIIKSFWANNTNTDPKKIFQVAIMPCMAKKFERDRTDLVNDGLPNTDAVLTTRELVRSIKRFGIDLAKLPDSDYDDPLGESTGAGKIFGASGGVMEAALRTGYWLVNNKNVEHVEFEAVRGMDSIKKAIIEITPEIKLSCVAVSGLANARKICDELREGNPNNYQFIEIMACPGGCINGGGQPRGLDREVLEQRAKALYSLDDNYSIRFSHENTAVQRLYSNFLKELGSHEAHHLLHTKYYNRKVGGQE
ncbi:NADH-dependent [FeFe] hydrogenase, group A6 [Candidatus Lokiarchaeum ossiferum]|uniref:NADH-dependent [FeFe] hydrogenase, group A6 n=1 Tax=Candidatus Lokiarchaeum ossiferum TaxID=2951803 RepID=UPI00352C9DA7